MYNFHKKEQSEPFIGDSDIGIRIRTDHYAFSKAQLYRRTIALSGYKLTLLTTHHIRLMDYSIIVSVTALRKLHSCLRTSGKYRWNIIKKTVCWNIINKSREGNCSKDHPTLL
ncbi:hypothetical protein CEXT_216681 [Caerostris extrusa]|uniref:Uncharacterized protein n=1 Tax=Caerostris extrusa TaxID=172846 RepID=A0AAV4QSV9_CAEEX|nr:hypothetical protein CEXT_216681 [Caerostris extrusa]